MRNLSSIQKAIPLLVRVLSQRDGTSPDYLLRSVVFASVVLDSGVARLTVRPVYENDECMRMKKAIPVILVLAAVAIALLLYEAVIGNRGSNRNRNSRVDGSGGPLATSQPKYLQVVQDPAQITMARDLATASRPKGITPELLADTWAYDLSELSPEFELPQKLDALRRIAANPNAVERGRTVAASFLLIHDHEEGEKAFLRLLQSGNRALVRGALLQLGFIKGDGARLKGAALLNWIRTAINDKAYRADVVGIWIGYGLPETATVLRESLATADDDPRGAGEILYWLAQVDPKMDVLEQSKALATGGGERIQDRALQALTELLKAEDESIARGAEGILIDLLLAKLRAGAVSVFDFPQSNCADVIREGKSDKLDILLRELMAKSKDAYLKGLAFERLHGKKDPGTKQFLIARLKTDDLRNAADTLKRSWAGSGDSEIVEALLLAARDSRNERHLESLVTAALEIGGDQALKGALALADRLSPWKRMEVHWTAEGIADKDVIDHLVEGGLLKRGDVSQATKTLIAEHKRDSPETEPKLSFLDVLGKAGLMHAFDTETGVVPVRHDQLIETLADVSHGALQVEASSEVMLKKHKEDWDAPYRVQFISKGRLYRFEARNLGDWYDVERVVIILNKALEDGGRQERFLPLNTGDQTSMLVCMKPAMLKELAEKYYLPIGDDLMQGVQSGKAYEKRVLDKLQEDKGAVVEEIR
jgi:hypothetical protein